MAYANFHNRSPLGLCTLAIPPCDLRFIIQRQEGIQCTKEANLRRTISAFLAQDYIYPRVVNSAAKP